jgi:hypothetical protein
LVDGHTFLGSDIAPAAIRKIRELRHFLVHRRGEIHTEEQRLRFRDEAAEEKATTSLSRMLVATSYLERRD